MVEIYVQEVGGHRFFAGLDQGIRHAIAQRAAQEGEAVQLALQLLQQHIPPARFPNYMQKLACHTRR